MQNPLDWSAIVILFLFAIGIGTGLWGWARERAGKEPWQQYPFMRKLREVFLLILSIVLFFGAAMAARYLLGK